MPKSIRHKDKILLLRVPTKQELIHFNSLKPSKSYAKYLGLIINEKLTVNSYSGNINELQDIVAKIKEALLK